LWRLEGLGFWFNLDPIGGLRKARNLNPKKLFLGLRLGMGFKEFFRKKEGFLKEG